EGAAAMTPRTSSRSRLRLLLPAAAALMTFTVSAGALPARQGGTGQGAEGLHVLPLRGNVYVLVGAGANITLSVGEEGVLLVDSGSAAAADNVIATVGQLARRVTAAPVPLAPCAGLGC